MFNRTIIQSTLPKSPKGGLKTMVFKSYSSQPNSLTSIQLNSFGNLLNANFINMKLH